MKLLKKISLKKALLSLWNNFKKNWQLFFAFFFSYILPVLMLSEIMVFTKEVPGGTKLTFMGCLAIGILFIIFRKKIKEAIIRMHKGILRWTLRIIMAGIFWGVIFGIIIGLNYITDVLKEYWINVAYCFAIGYIFYFMDEVKKRKKKLIIEEETDDE